MEVDLVVASELHLHCAELGLHGLQVFSCIRLGLHIFICTDF
jgi:hypothetical protein